MNPRLETLHAYPFERLRRLLADVRPPEGLPPIDLSIGEPKHATPPFVMEALKASLDGLAAYPPTKGPAELRRAMSEWIARRYGIEAPNPETQVLPVHGSREALFAFAQTVVDASRDAVVICPNPFYQIYEGASLLAGATPWYLNADPQRGHGYDWDAIPENVLQKCQLIYVCSPGNPAGNVLTLEDWRKLFELSDRYGFVIAADECYSEIYFDEAVPPLGGLEAAVRFGRNDFRRLVSFSSLSKRSSLPGLRSGYVAGDAAVLDRFLLYRTYHGSAMSLVTAKTSLAAWGDEDHVVQNRRLYREKLDTVLPLLQPVLDVSRPEAAFFLWAGTPYDDTEFVRDLYAATGVTTLPGSYLARESLGINPGSQRIRIALVAPQAQCEEAAQRIVEFCSSTSFRNPNK
ncbi:MAG TPA: succinyldiaminopimelate transaminase [Burkholderiaceae bacterium]|nr:succinyldiaminopimelate transaminase [Burkholderiaceae bacterium]